MISVLDPDTAQADLAAGRLSCPVASCRTPLRPWGYARLRRVRELGATRLALRPRRARCPGCGVTHVLLAAVAQPHRADASVVIGAVLAAAAAGRGHRAIAVELDRSPWTVRRWLRSVRDIEVIEGLRGRALDWLFSIDPDRIATLPVARTRLGDALQALAAAALATRTRLAPHVPVWALATLIAGGRLLPAARSG